MTEGLRMTPQGQGCIDRSSVGRLLRQAGSSSSALKVVKAPRLVVSVPVSGRQSATADRLGNNTGVRPITVPTLPRRQRATRRDHLPDPDEPAACPGRSACGTPTRRASTACSPLSRGNRSVERRHASLTSAMCAVVRGAEGTTWPAIQVLTRAQAERLPRAAGDHTIECLRGRSPGCGDCSARRTRRRGVQV